MLAYLCWIDVESLSDAIMTANAGEMKTEKKKSKRKRVKNDKNIGDLWTPGLHSRAIWMTYPFWLTGGNRTAECATSHGRGSVPLAEQSHEENDLSEVFRMILFAERSRENITLNSMEDYDQRKIIEDWHENLHECPCKPAKAVGDTGEDDRSLSSSSIGLYPSFDSVPCENADEYDRLSTGPVASWMDWTWTPAHHPSVPERSSEQCRTDASYSYKDLQCNVRRHHDPCRR